MPDIIFPYLEELINQIPKGKVTTFKIIAEYLGSEYAIKYIINNYKKCKYWYRVVNEKGIINNEIQKLFLINEGIEIKDNKVDLKKYLFKEFKIKEKILEKYRKIQEDIRNKIILEDKIEKIEIIGGVDISYSNDIANIVYVLFDKNLNFLDYKVFREEVDFPYIPTFLAFREGEPILKVMKNLDKPDILFVNGFGIAHPVRVGLATYIGVELNILTIGITKSLLYGKINNEIIFDENTGEKLGFVINKFGHKVYVSPGNLISLESSREISYKYWIKGRYPEPIRVADEISKKIKNYSLKA